MNRKIFLILLLFSLAKLSFSNDSNFVYDVERDIIFYKGKLYFSSNYLTPTKYIGLRTTIENRMLNEEEKKTQIKESEKTKEKTHNSEGKPKEGESKGEGHKEKEGEGEEHKVSVSAFWMYIVFIARINNLTFKCLPPLLELCQV